VDDMKNRELFYMILVWGVCSALVYFGMSISDSSMPLFGLSVPVLVSLGVLNRGRD